MTSKTSVAAAMSVVALPAAVLGFFVVSTFLTQLGKLTTTFMVLYAVTLAACAAMFFLPFAVLIFGPKSPKGAPLAVPAADAARTSKKGKRTDDDSFEEGDAGLGDEPIEGPISETIAEPMGTGELDLVEDGLSEDSVDAIEPQFDSGTIDAFDDDAEFAFDDEEPPPKKKKGK